MNEIYTNTKFAIFVKITSESVQKSLIEHVQMYECTNIYVYKLVLYANDFCVFNFANLRGERSSDRHVKLT